MINDQLPILDETTKKGLNNLTREEVDRNVSYAYEHEILWYGMDAIAHIVLMRNANNTLKGKWSMDQFIQKYDLKFGKINRYFNGISMPLKKVELDGIFIPQQAYWDEEGKIKKRELCFFNPDYSNRIDLNSYGFFYKKKAKELVAKTWGKSDLENPELIQQGIEFGKQMWGSCVEEFEKKKKTTPQKVIDLCEKLNRYYSNLVYL